MTKSQKLAQEINDIDRQLVDLVTDTKDKRTAEEKAAARADLDKRRLRLQNDYDAALAAELAEEGHNPPVDGETRERDRLTARADLGAMFSNLVNGRAHDGAEAEVLEAFGLPASAIPVDMLRGAGALNVVTPAPSETGANQDAPIPAVFPRSVAAFLGVSMPVVETGKKQYPVMETDDVAADVDEGASPAAPAGTFAANELSPRRITASFEYSLEDAAVFVGMDSALRQNLSAALMSGLDAYVLNKAAIGLLTHGNNPTAEAGAETFARYRAAIIGAVDGAYAGDASELRAVVGSATYASMSAAYNSDGDMSALRSLVAEGVGVRVTKHVAAPAGNIQQAVVAVGMAMNAVAPVWQGVQIIVDRVTLAQAGQVRLTAVLLAQFKVLRAAGFKRLAFRLSA